MRLRPLAVALALLGAWGAVAGAGTGAAQTQTLVRSAPEFLDALTRQNASVIELAGPVTVTREDVAAVEGLPALVPPNTTLYLRGGGTDGPTPLSFGDQPFIIHAKGGATVVLEGLAVSGLNPPPGSYSSPTSMGALMVWPAVGGDVGSSFVFNNTTIHLVHEACTEAAVAQTIDTSQRLIGPNAVMRANGTTGIYTSLAFPFPVANTTTGDPLGTANLAVSYTNITCSLPSSSSGTPGWVWAVVGVAAALALAAGGVAALLWRRRRRLASQQQQAVLPLEGKPGEGASTSGDTPDLEGQRGAAGAEEGGALSPFALSAHQRLGSAPASSNNTLSPLSSSIGKLPSMEVPETMWRSRVGFIEGLKIGGMIGRGGFAEVYRGTWHGTPVAVKVVRTHVGPGHQLDLSREPMLSMSVAHPNVIASYKMCVVKLLMDNGAPPPATPGGSELSPAGSGLSSSNPSGNPSGSRLVASVTGKGCLAEVMPLEAVLSPGLYETWVVTELAERGSMADAISSGVFKQAEAPGVNLPVVTLCLLDISRGLQYLHSCGIVHGDLKPENVLLKAARSDRRGYVCKLGDFGLSRLLGDEQTHVDTGNFGTISHAAPERLTEGMLTKKSDIWALGLVIWEVLTGQRPFKNMPQLQILFSVVQNGHRPAIPEWCPSQLAELMQRCWAADPQARPDAAAVVEALQEYAAVLRPGTPASG